jgi:hypothetical protein
MDKSSYPARPETDIELTASKVRVCIGNAGNLLMGCGDKKRRQHLQCLPEKSILSVPCYPVDEPIPKPIFDSYLPTPEQIGTCQLRPWWEETPISAFDNLSSTVSGSLFIKTNQLSPWDKETLSILFTSPGISFTPRNPDLADRE